jgi:hypothetical protein
MWSETERKISAEYGLQHNSLPLRLTLSVYTVQLVWEGGGGQRKDIGATVHEYSSFVHGGNSSQAGSKIPTNE